VTLGRRDGGEVEALITDRYLDSLLAIQASPRLVGGPLDSDASLSAAVRAVSRRLATDLPRFHPSFRFVDDLAARLATAAAGPRDETGRLIDFPSVLLRDDRPVPVRPVVLGGVLTSAALSLAGAAYVAWRRGHPPAGPMSRAVRAVARARTV
jgi:hypothetical protein